MHHGARGCSWQVAVGTDCAQSRPGWPSAARLLITPARAGRWAATVLGCGMLSLYYTGRHSGCNVRRMSVKPGWARKRPAAARALSPKTRRPDRAVAPEEQPFWVLSRGEQRVLLITFVGGVDSIVVAVLIVGGAIAIARRSGRGAGSWAAFTWSMGVFCVLAAIGARRMLRSEVHLPDPARLIALVVAGSFSVGYLGLLAIGMLVLIGIAAGIK